MGRTTIEVDEETRDRLRRFKALDGLTYDQALDELLDAYPWADVADAQPAEPAVTAAVSSDSEGSDEQDQDEDQDSLGVDFPANQDRAACVEAIGAARAYLREHGPASMAEITASVMPDHPAGYDAEAALETIGSGGRYRGGWWRSVVKPGLAALDDVEAPGPGANEWRVVDS